MMGVVHLVAAILVTTELINPHTSLFSLDVSREGVELIIVGAFWELQQWESHQIVANGTTRFDASVGHLLPVDTF
jgi:hypothetical protein